MKKVSLILLTLSSLVFAKSYTQEDRIKDMQEMAKDMQNIQNGFFYNNFDMIKLGGVALAETIQRVEPPLSEKEEKDALTRLMNGKVKMTNKIKTQAKRNMERMIDEFADGDKVGALQYYMNTTRLCMQCHKKLRKW
jgi:hypothetical protein